MDYGICPLSVVPGRGEPTDKSEMVTQLLFGEAFSILEENDKWFKVRLIHDQYECWVDKKQVDLLEDNSSIEDHPHLVTDLYSNVVDSNTQSVVPVVMGSMLHNFDGGGFNMGPLHYQFNGKASRVADPAPENVGELAMQLLNLPYLWGGRSSYGMDCSGLSQLIYRMCGLNIPRDSFQQATLGNELELVEEALDGDLAFFQNEEGRITHVGVVLSEQDPSTPGKMILHASGKVRLDPLDQEGIYNLETESYSHVLSSVKMLF
jgi:cell wall-associated NlpC family hydrolase